MRVQHFTLSVLRIDPGYNSREEAILVDSRITLGVQSLSHRSARSAHYVIGLQLGGKC